jgi:hypothetical protein
MLPKFQANFDEETGLVGGALNVYERHQFVISIPQKSEGIPKF